MRERKRMIFAWKSIDRTLPNEQLRLGRQARKDLGFIGCCLFFLAFQLNVFGSALDIDQPKMERVWDSALGAFVSRDAVVEKPIAPPSRSPEVRRSASSEARWNELAGSGDIPAMRGGHVITNGPAGRCLLFGGNNLDQNGWNHFNDTYSVTTEGVWDRIATTGNLPSPRFSATGVYDPIDDRLIVFGGTYRGITCYNDTHALNLDTGEWSLLTTAGTPPGERRNHTAVYDSARRRMIVFGGTNSPTADSSYNDMHALDLATLQWSELVPTMGTLPNRRAHAAEYSSALDAVVIFGGDHVDVYYNDLIIYSCATGMVSRPETTGLAHPVGLGMSSFLAPSSYEMFIFGGYTDVDRSNHILSTIHLVTGEWQRIDTSTANPGARHWTMLAPVAEGSRALLFGGLTRESGYANDTWMLLSGILSARHWRRY